MMRQPLLLLFLTALTFAACHAPDKTTPALAEVIPGKAMPLRLAPDSTWIPLSDFCPEKPARRGGLDTAMGRKTAAKPHGIQRTTWRLDPWTTRTGIWRFGIEAGWPVRPRPCLCFYTAHHNLYDAPEWSRSRAGLHHGSI